MLFSLFSQCLCVNKTMDLAVFADGLWNATGGYIDHFGTFHPLNFLYNLTLERTPENNQTFTGVLKGIEPNMNILVRINNKTHSFAIENNYAPGLSKVLCEAQMIYGKRNLPHAFGKWVNDSQTFKLIVYTFQSFELQVFRPDRNITSVYRFIKTPRPEFPVWPVIKSCLFIGFFMVAYKIIVVREYLADKRAKKGKNEQNEKKGQPEKALKTD